jgi:hypothetical protein
MDCIRVGSAVYPAASYRPGVYYSISRKQFFVSFSSDSPSLPALLPSDTFIPIKIGSDNTIKLKELLYSIEFDSRALQYAMGAKI